MAIEAINKIKDVENAAAQAIKEASEKAKEMAKDADTESLKKYRQIIADAMAEKEEIIKKAREDAEAESMPIAQAGNAEIEKIKNPDPEKFSEAVKLVVERIVGR